MLLIATGNIFAQQLPVTTYAPDNGVLFAGVNSVFQDAQGWMWFTSSYDVVRYDGHEFRKIPLAQNVEMDFCYGIIDAGYELWVLATPYPLLIQDDTLHRLERPILSAGFVAMTGIGERQYALFDNGLYEMHNDTFVPLITDQTFAFQDEHILSYDHAHLVTYESGKSLIVFDLIDRSVQRHLLPVVDISQDEAGRLFMLLKEKGVYILNTLPAIGEKPDTALYVSIDAAGTKFLEMDGAGNVYVGIPDKALLRINLDKSISTFSESDGLPSLWFLDMFRDREGNVWIGFNNGLCKIRNVPWQRYTKDQGLYSNYIFFFIEDGANVYLGTYSGVNVYSDQTLRQVRNGDSPFECKSMILSPRALSESRREIFALRGDQLVRAEIDERTFQIREESILTQVPAMALYLAQDSSGTLFIATNAGLFAWHRGKLQTVQGSTHYHQVFVDSRQHLWAAAFGNVLEVYQVVYSGNSIELHATQVGDSIRTAFPEIRQVRAIAEDTFGNVYAGTRYQGLYQFSFAEDRMQSIRHLTEQDGLKSNSIWGLTIDSGQDCWIATARGINRFDPVRDTIFAEGSTAKIFTSAAIYAADNGIIWVASHPGVIVLDKEDHPSAQFEITITGVSVNAIPLEMSRAHVFDHTENNLSFTYSANTFLDESEVMYQYRLLHNGKGGWSPSTKAHSIQFPALQSGKYDFSVNASNGSGVPGMNIAHWSFEILPPFWKRSWFVVLMVIVAFGMAYVLYRYRIRQLMKLQRMRNNISRNLHDDIGASLSNINILNALTLRNLADPKKAESYLVQSGEDIQRISESLSDIVWNVNPINDDLDHVYSHMKRYAADMLEGKNIAAHLDFPSPGGKVHLSMEKRRDFFLIFKEAINNMVKYSQATEAEVQVKEEGNSLYLIIEDNGIGFNVLNGNGGNGLHNMRQRASNWNATLEIKSSPGQGSRIALRMKIG